jgi:hypothetical protein
MTNCRVYAPELLVKLSGILSNRQDPVVFVTPSLVQPNAGKPTPIKFPRHFARFRKTAIESRHVAYQLSRNPSRDRGLVSRTMLECNESRIRWPIIGPLDSAQVGVDLVTVTPIDTRES